jgi:hypothetical protein
MEVRAFMGPECQLEFAYRRDDRVTVGSRLDEHEGQEQKREVGVCFCPGMVTALIHEDEQRAFIGR